MKSEDLLQAIVEEINNTVGRDGNPPTLEGTAARLILEARGMIVRAQYALEEMRQELAECHKQIVTMARANLEHAQVELKTIKEDLQEEMDVRALRQELEELRKERDFYREGGVNFPGHPVTHGKCTTESCLFPRWPGYELCLRCDPSPIRPR